MSIKKLKWWAILSFIVAMAVLIGGGFMAKDKVPPLPRYGERPGRESTVSRNPTSLRARTCISATASWTTAASGGTDPKEARSSPPLPCTSMSDAVRDHLAQQRSQQGLL